MAQYNLGVMYANGQGVPKDEKQAVVWYRKAAEQGYADAQHNLGLMQEETMSGFWWGVAIVAVLWLFFSMRSKTKAIRSFSALDEAAPWFLKNNISSGSAMFSTYEDSVLARNSGATIIVGDGKNAQGESVGFALEVLPGQGVVASEILVPYGIATHHKTASLQARMSDQPLLDVLVAMAANHRVR